MVVLGPVEQLIIRIQIDLTISTEGKVGLVSIFYLQAAKALMPAYTKRDRLDAFGRGLQLLLLGTHW